MEYVIFQWQQFVRLSSHNPLQQLSLSTKKTESIAPCPAATPPSFASLNFVRNVCPTCLLILISLASLKIKTYTCKNKNFLRNSTTEWFHNGQKMMVILTKYLFKWVAKCFVMLSTWMNAKNWNRNDLYNTRILG